MRLSDYSVKVVNTGWSDIVKHDIYEARVFIEGRETTRSCPHSHKTEAAAAKCVAKLAQDWQNVLEGLLDLKIVDDQLGTVWEVETRMVWGGELRTVTLRWRMIDEYAGHGTRTRIL